jgi:hypothetical protein
LNLTDQAKKDLRPKLLNVVVNEDMHPDEIFQNQTLRPILKFQHETIIRMTQEYIKNKKNIYHNLNAEQKSDYLKNTLLADRMKSHELKGIIIAMFTLNELEYYLENKSRINKRIQALLFQRMEGAV